MDWYGKWPKSSNTTSLFYINKNVQSFLNLINIKKFLHIGFSKFYTYKQNVVNLLNTTKHISSSHKTATACSITALSYILWCLCISKLYNEPNEGVSKAMCGCLLIIIHLCQQIILCLPAKPNTLSSHMWSDWFSVFSLWFFCWYTYIVVASFYVEKSISFWFWEKAYAWEQLVFSIQLQRRNGTQEFVNVIDYNL